VWLRGSQASPFEQSAFMRHSAAIASPVPALPVVRAPLALAAALAPASLLAAPKPPLLVAAPLGAELPLPEDPPGLGAAPPSCALWPAVPKSPPCAKPLLPPVPLPPLPPLPLPPLSLSPAAPPFPAIAQAACPGVSGGAVTSEPQFPRLPAIEHD
jgi:hypothetical protein